MLLTGEHTDVSLPMQDFVSVHVVAVAAVTLMVLLATATVLLLLPPFSLLCQSAAARLLLPLYGCVHVAGVPRCSAATLSALRNQIRSDLAEYYAHRSACLA